MNHLILTYILAANLRADFLPSKTFSTNMQDIRWHYAKNISLICEHFNKIIKRQQHPRPRDQGRKLALLMTT
jgi:hypothetical protein